MPRYQEVSKQIHELFNKFSPLVESVSIDEAFIDMTGCEHFYSSIEAIGQTIKSEITSKTGLTCSVGIAPNKFLAKLASEWKKPNGLTIIRSQQIDEFLISLPVEKLWGVGSKTKQVLKQHKIDTVSDLRQHSLKWLKDNLGEKFGQHLYNLARGIDNRRVEPYSEVKSISQEITFEYDRDNQDF